MKKLTIVALVACVAMFAVSCKNQPKEAAAEEPAAVEEVVAAEPAADTTAAAAETPAETPACENCEAK